MSNVHNIEKLVPGALYKVAAHRGTWAYVLRDNPKEDRRAPWVSYNANPNRIVPQECPFLTGNMIFLVVAYEGRYYNERGPEGTADLFVYHVLIGDVAGFVVLHPGDEEGLERLT